MNQDFTISALVFTIVMVVFSIIKDVVILPKYNISDTYRKKITRRWYISYIIGIIILLITYGRDGP
jgi:hypothetical protein